LTGSVSVNVPAGVTEAIVLIRTACPATSTNAIGASNYAIVTHAVGAQTLLFSANLGPPDSTGTPTATFCPTQSQSGGTGGTAYDATAYAVGFDYPAYESSYPFNVAQTPQITNATGQADVTTSAPATFTGP
jgi:hypothetical protein